MSAALMSKLGSKLKYLLLIFGLLAAAESLRLSVSIYLQYQQIEATSVLGEGNAFLMQTRNMHHRLNRLPPHEEERALDEFFADLKPHGLHYFFHEGRRHYLERGQLTLPRRAINDLERRGELISVGQDRYFIVLPPLRGEDAAYVTSIEGAKPRAETPRHFTPPILAVEFSPKRTQAMMAQAKLHLALSILGASLLLLISVSLFLLLRRQELTKRELEQRRLLASLGQMYAVISHELRNPLTAAMGQAELLHELLEDDDAKTHAAKVIAQLERVELLSNTLLDFINAKRINRELVEVGALIKLLKDELVDEHRVELIIGPLPERFFIDVRALKDALLRLVDNALFFSPQDRLVELHLDMDGDALCFCVRDHGPGLGAQLADVLTPFYTTREGRTGLGLSIVSEIVSAHRGEFALSAHPQGGVEACICLPKVEMSTITITTKIHI